MCICWEPLFNVGLSVSKTCNNALGVSIFGLDIKDHDQFHKKACLTRIGLQVLVSSKEVIGFSGMVLDSHRPGLQAVLNLNIGT